MSNLGNLLTDRMIKKGKLFINGVLEEKEDTFYKMKNLEGNGLFTTIVEGGSGKILFRIQEAY